MGTSVHAIMLSKTFEGGGYPKDCYITGHAGVYLRRFGSWARSLLDKSCAIEHFRCFEREL